MPTLLVGKYTGEATLRNITVVAQSVEGRLTCGRAASVLGEARNKRPHK